MTFWKTGPVLFSALLVGLLGTQTAAAQTALCSKQSVIDPGLAAAAQNGNCSLDGIYISPTTFASDLANKCATAESCRKCVERGADQVVDTLQFLQKNKYLLPTAIRDFKLALKSLAPQACNAPGGDGKKPGAPTETPDSGDGSKPDNKLTPPPSTPKPTEGTPTGDNHPPPTPNSAATPPATPTHAPANTPIGQKSTYAEFVSQLERSCPIAAKGADGGQPAHPWAAVGTDPCGERTACVNNVAKNGVDHGYFAKNDDLYRAVNYEVAIKCNF